MEEYDLECQHKTLNINNTHNTYLYSARLKHNNYTSVFSCSLKENLPETVHSHSDLSLSRTNLNISLPYPIVEPFPCDFENDPCQQIVQEKAEFNRRLERCRRLYTKEKKKLFWTNIKAKRNEPNIYLPRYLVELAQNGDENSYFQGSYDWFYTGGNLEVAEIEDYSFLISTQGDKLVAIQLKNYSKQQLKIPVMKAPIYSIKSYYIDNMSYLTLRNKDSVKVVQLHFANEINISTKETYQLSIKKTSPPFIDAALIGDSKLITANVKYEMKIHDIEASTISQEVSFQSPTSGNGELCQLEAISNCILFMGRDSLSLYDSRSADERVKNFKEGFFKCDDLCAICLSTINNNFVFIASRHSVYKCDLREMKIVKKWGHLLDNSPIKIKTMPGNKEGDEYVLLASFDETICIHVSQSANHMPFKLRDITTCYNKLKWDNEFLLREDVEKRFQLSTSGLAVYDTSIFVGNSVGDVFKQDIVSSETIASKYELHVLNKLKEYVNAWPCRPRQLQVTHFKELSELRDSLWSKVSKRKEVEALKAYVSENRRAKKFLNPNVKFGKYDMAMIWQTGRRVGPLDNDSGSEAQQRERIDSWLAQSSAGKYESNEYMEF